MCIESGTAETPVAPPLLLPLLLHPLSQRRLRPIMNCTREHKKCKWAESPGPPPPSLRFQFRVFGTTKRQIREKLKEKGYDATLQHERKIAILLYFNNALRYVIPTRNSAGAPARASSSTISIPFSIWTRSLSMSLRVAIAVAVAVWGLSTNSRLAMQPKSSFTHSQSYFVCGQVINSFRSLHALGLFIRQHCLLEFV